ncbi:MAG: hypothetical protein JWL90_3802, partial [Chthoniobacteraceae bacterium]|nr:hypothetical protein [Chthoniobacteraceae bacterium]
EFELGQHRKTRNQHHEHRDPLQCDECFPILSARHHAADTEGKRCDSNKMNYLVRDGIHGADHGALLKSFNRANHEFAARFSLHFSLIR